MRTIFIFLLSVALFLPTLWAQERRESPRQYLLTALPSALELHGEALGDRVRKPGKERTVFGGFLIDERRERTPIWVIAQLPTLVRLEGIRPKAPPAVFDGKNPVFAGSRLEEQLLEVFSSDTAEGMLASVKEGFAVQLLGRSIRASEASSADKSRNDVFEVAGPVQSNAGGLERLKWYYFDSESGLLSKTQYLDESFSPPVNVETLFSQWRKEDGSAYPGRIDRAENGRLVYSLIITSVSVTPRQDLTTFAEAPLSGTQEE